MRRDVESNKIYPGLTSSTCIKACTLFVNTFVFIATFVFLTFFLYTFYKLKESQANDSDLRLCNPTT